MMEVPAGLRGTQSSTVTPVLVMEVVGSVYITGHCEEKYRPGFISVAVIKYPE